MQFQFSFKHMDTSPALQTYAEDKLREKIGKFVTKPIAAHVTFSVVRHQHTAHLSFDAGDGFSLEVEHTTGDMYITVDELVGKLNTQLQRRKDKLKDHKGVKFSRSVAEGEEVAVADAVDAADIIKFERARKRAAAQ